MPGSNGGRKYKKEKRIRMNLEMVTSELMMRLRNAGHQIDLPEDMLPAIEMLLQNGITPMNEAIAGLDFEPDFVVAASEPELEVEESPDLDDVNTLGPETTDEAYHTGAPAEISEDLMSQQEMLQKWAAGNRRMLERVATSGVSYNGNGNPEVEGRTLVPDVDKSPRSMKNIVKPVAQAARAAAQQQAGQRAPAQPQQGMRPAQPGMRPAQPGARPQAPQQGMRPPQGPPQGMRPPQAQPNQAGPRMTAGGIASQMRRPAPRPQAPTPDATQGAEAAPVPQSDRRVMKNGLTLQQQRAILEKATGVRPGSPPGGRPNTIRGGR